MRVLKMAGTALGAAAGVSPVLALLEPRPAPAAVVAACGSARGMIFARSLHRRAAVGASEPAR